MTDREVSELIDLLYPYFIKKLETEGVFKKCIKSTNAEVTWVNTSAETNVGEIVKVKIPYDTSDMEVYNKSTSELAVGDLVCLHYNIDFKNAYVAYIANRATL